MSTCFVRINLVGAAILVTDVNGFPVPIRSTGPLAIVGTWLCLRADVLKERDTGNRVKLPDGQEVWVARGEMRDVAA